MSGFSVHPDAVAGAGQRIVGAAQDAAGIGAALRAALSGIGGAAGHPGVSAAAESAGARWLGGAQAWAAGAAGLGDAAVAAAAAYVEVDRRRAEGFGSSSGAR